eukprot:403360691
MRKFVNQKDEIQDNEDQEHQSYKNSNFSSSDSTQSPSDFKFNAQELHSGIQRPGLNFLRLGFCFVVGNILYQYIAQQKCEYDGLYECIDKFLLPGLAEGLVIIGISALFFTFIIWKNFSCKNKQKATVLLVVFINIILMSVTNTTISKQRFGGMYGVAFLLYVILFIILLLLKQSVLKIKPYMNLRRTLILSFIFLLFLRYVFEFKVMTSCQNWAKGLHSEMINSEQFCEIQQPTICVYELSDRIQDFSFASCRGSLEEAKASGHEQIIDVQNNNLNQYVNKNQKLIDQRKILQQENGLTNNLIIIYVDALSRQRAHFKLPETMQFFKEQDTFEFFRYHGFSKRTYENALMFLYGMKVDQLEGEVAQKKSSIFEFFKQSGYIVGHASNLCESNIFEMGAHVMKYVENNSADHESMSAACDPNYHNPENSFGPFQGPFSIVRRCLYGKDTFEHVMEFGRQFQKTYKNEKKVIWLDFIDFHEGTGEVVNYLDGPLSKFLKEVQNEDTTIMLMSDHGFHMGGLKIATAGYQYTTELMLPSMFISNLKGLSSQDYANIKQNQQKLITHRELHNFWKYWSTGKQEGNSFISEMPDDRETCKDIGQYCLCSNY